MYQKLDVSGRVFQDDVRIETERRLRLHVSRHIDGRRNTRFSILNVLYQRLMARGKAKKLSITILKRKLVVLANLLLKNPQCTLVPQDSC